MAGTPQDTFEKHSLPGSIGEPVEDSVDSALAELSLKSFFQRGVVIEVLNNLSLRDDDQLSLMVRPSGKGGLPLEAADKKVKVDDLINNEALAMAPRDSVIVRLVSPPATDGAPGSKGRTTLQTIVCYPFFSSHLSLPIKVGEHVWVFFEAGVQNDVPIKDVPGLEAWWMTRIVGPSVSEDPNYSHYDRRYDQTSKEGSDSIKLDKKENLDPAKKPADDYKTMPSFFNGSEQSTDENSFTMMFAEEYKDYYYAWAAKDDFVIEPVPRFTKRPGDLVLQGSHNSTIILGTDRGWKHDVKPDPSKGTAKHKSIVSNAHRAESDGPLAEGLGAIDIVVGRGRLSGAPGAFKDAAPETGTEPLVVINSKEQHETNKNPGVIETQKDNVPFPQFNNRAFAAEGDPHFVNDSARVYLTMKSNPDDQFAIIPDNIPTAFASAPVSIKDTAAAVIKSDEIRIIARKQGLPSQSHAEPKTKGNVNGSIRIIKEGVLNDDAAAIYLLPDGTIQVSGKVIFLGRADGADKGSDKLTAGEGPGKSEPYLRYSDFEIWADGLIDAVNTAFVNAQAAINGNGDTIAAMSKAGATGGVAPPVGPNVLLGKAFAEGAKPPGKDYDHAGDKTAIDKFKSKQEKMKAIKSKRIFGE